MFLATHNQLAGAPAWFSVSRSRVLTTKATNFCPPLDLADPGASCSLSLGPRVPSCARPAHGCSRSGWHAACPSTCPAPPRSRFGGADYELLERAHHGTLGPSDSEATLLQLGRPAVRMSSKHEVALSSRRTTARNHPRQGAKVHLLASEVSLRLPDVRSACAVTGRQ